MLCSKEVLFTCSNGIYEQNDDVAMGLPLGPALAVIFMVKIETSEIPIIGKSLLKWKRYVENTLCYVKVATGNDILNNLNGFY